ncbi:MAG: ester cyclase [Chloroflexi bacterium]|nr:ester cyclase [Chloroflexota bacterium]
MWLVSDSNWGPSGYESESETISIWPRGIHTGAAFLGAAPSGKRFVIGAISILRRQDGKIVEHWLNEDEMGILHQSGLPAFTAS